MPQDRCPFCHPDAERIAFVHGRVFGFWDGFPVSPGHILVIPRRHVATWFDATAEEQQAINEGLKEAKRHVEKKHHPDGYNIGINVGKAGGQTIDHLHVHLIPRYAGDVANPRGGIRHVIPGKGDYMAPATGRTEKPATGKTPRLITGGESDPLLPYLAEQFAKADKVDIAVGFVQPSGVTRLEEHLRDFVERRQGRLRLLTGDYLGITDPDALVRLLDLEGHRDLRVFETWRPPTPEHPGPSPTVSFHPKSYVFRNKDGHGTAFIGSSNMTESALTSGIEWNYRVVSSQEGTPFATVVREFENLFTHPATRPLDEAWIDAYRRRRPVQLQLPKTAATDVEVESTKPPEPHEIQQEALAKLEATREEGYTAGLVVLATGLGKTWLSAFDSDRPQFRRILFVAHREEILGQALRTFRQVRPEARLGHYTGQGKDPAADILFASIQTLGRNHHLQRFARDAFDYIVVDEFHHASARTYRNLIDHFRPKFLLGLTATPERTDGGDLLALCQENLVYRCDLLEGLRRALLCRFEYFGVPDEVDYSNIPWRNARFDEDELTARLAVDSRASNALDQLEKRGGRRALAFCVSQRHADFMAAYLTRHDKRAVAVHSGPTSAPRAESLEKLSAGHLDVICAVDVFNEGLDLPELDTILMLRPTESRIVWLQQLGRGLRKTTDDKLLKVIDYIGNHRSFLLKPRTLMGLGAGDHEVFNFIERLRSGPLEIAPGCFVTYDLKTIEILRSLMPPTKDILPRFYKDFVDLHDVRPTAAEAFHEGYDPGGARKTWGSWLGFVKEREGLTPDQAKALEAHRDWLTNELETTAMTKSYKMLVLLAMLNKDTFPGEIPLPDLATAVLDLASRNPMLKAELGPEADLPAMLVRNPINAWLNARNTAGQPFFRFDNNVLATTFNAEGAERTALQELTRELVDWRLARYLLRTESKEKAAVCPVKHSNGRPMVFLHREKNPTELPLGTTRLLIDGTEYEGDFVKVALNVIRKPGDDKNVIAEIMRGWFGADAGQPGTNHAVAFEQTSDGWTMKPVGRREGQLELWRAYTREQIPPMFGSVFNPGNWNQGVVVIGNHVILLVTLEKGGHSAEFQYKDKFLSPTLFQWESQNRTARNSTLGDMLQNHGRREIRVHLFVRKGKREKNNVGRFTYCGEVRFRDWENDQPITVRWLLPEAVPERLREELQSPGPEAPE